MTSIVHRVTHGHSWATDVPRVLAGAAGAVFLIVGIAGFAVTGFDDVASEHGESLLGFHVNPLHNVVHLVIGVVGLACAWLAGKARIFGWFLFVGYGLAFGYGLFALDKSWDFLALNAADNGLHLGAALFGLLIALWPRSKSDDAVS